eukprot:7212879-Alexandrium_andersonii.AAC.1
MDFALKTFAQRLLRRTSLSTASLAMSSVPCGQEPTTPERCKRLLNGTHNRICLETALSFEGFRLPGWCSLS